jgi:transcriptional regulator of acetoin/glycerol metabolism
MEDRQIRRAWERFMEHGRTDATVRDAVLASWTRSLNHHVAADRDGTTTMSEGELHRRRHAGRRLLEAAQPALRQAEGLLGGSPSMLIVTDADGAVLETAGDRRTIAHGGEIGLGSGGLWSEGIIGTNAIGTALATDAPVKIHSFEHFCSQVQQWSCAAAPIHDPRNGHTLGIIDLSGQPATATGRDLAYAVAVARQIEAMLGHHLHAEHATLLQRFLQRRSQWRSDGVLLVDGSGHILHATDLAQRNLDQSCTGLIEHDSIVMLAQSPPERWLPLLRQRLPRCELEIVVEQGHGIGAIIVLPESGRQRTSAPAARSMASACGNARTHLDAILGDSPAMREARQKAARIAASADMPILIEGETGVGKELFARAIHDATNPAAPFVPVNCGGLPRDLIGSEIFGYVRGAFTGADASGHPGKIEAAAGGSLCLDEIGEMPLELQPYLLRVLEDGVVYRIGSHAPLHIRTRVISMTNRDLLGESGLGRFRSDLFYRIAVLRLQVPPLRERGDDILTLVEHFARRAAERCGVAVPHFTASALDQLRRYHWPGNVRQLRNIVDTLVFLNEHRQITLDDLPPEVKFERPHAAPARDLRSIESDAISSALRACRGNLSQAARHLGIARSTLYARMQSMRIPVGDQAIAHAD